MKKLAGSLAAFVMLALTGIAVADLAVKDGSGANATMFDFLCFTTKHCSASVIVTSAGVEVAPATHADMTTLTAAVNGPIPAGTAVIGGVNPAAATSGGATPSFVVAAASNNSTNLKNGAGVVYGVQTSSIAATAAYFIKLYDKSTAPTCGTDTPVAVYVIPPANGGNNVVLPVGKQFSAGIGYCIVTGIANSDNTSVPAATVVANIDWK